MSINYLSPNDRKALDIKDFTDFKESQVVTKEMRYQRFYEICESAYVHILDNYQKKVQNESEDRNDYIAIFHNAMMGEQAAVEYLKSDIETYISENGFRKIEHPDFYETIVEGVYEEAFGWGPLSVWKKTGDLSEGAQVIGTDIKFKTKAGQELQNFSFRSLKQVERVCALLANLEPNTKLNRFTKTELETQTKDGIRVSIMIPNRMIDEPVITLRKQTETQYEFSRLAELGSFMNDHRVIRMFELLSILKLCSVIAGPPACGKSTLLLTMLKEIAYRKEATLIAQATEEFKPRSIFKRSNLIPVIAEGHEFEKIVSKSMLRHDVVNVVIGEIREYEAGLYRRASLQGIKQVMGTLHDMDPFNIPEILKSLYMIYNSNNVNEDNVYKMFVKNTHFSISMDELQGKKRVLSIQFYDYDRKNKEVVLTPIMLFDNESESWTFQSKIPERIVRQTMKYNREEMIEFIRILQSLEKDYPMPDEYRVMKESQEEVLAYV